MKKIVINSLLIASAILSIPAQAAVEINDSIDISLLAFVPCANGGTGELVDMSGPLHTLITYTINNNNVSGLAHFQPQGISGVGLTTGTKYQATGITESHFKGSFINGQYNETYVNNFRIIGQGPGNNYLVHENFHVTINANGEVSTVHDNFSVDCK